MSKIRNSEETKERILCAAQSLFAQRGFEAVSLREITAEAEANVAAVNYHFGGKDALIDAVIVRHMMPVMTERMKLLAVAQQRADDSSGVIPVVETLDAFMRPFLMVMNESGENKALFAKFCGRIMSDVGSNLPAEAVEQFSMMVQKFTQALSQALPHVGQQELMWRLHFSFGVMAHTLMHGERLVEVTKGACGEPDFETTLKRMIDYCIGGLEA